MRSKPNPACKWRHRKESQDQKIPNQKTAPGKVSAPSTASLDWNRKYLLPRRSHHLAKQRFSQPSKVLEGRTKTQTPRRDVACLIYGKHRDLFTSDIIRSASYLQGRATTKKLDTGDSNKKHLDLFWCSHSSRRQISPLLWVSPLSGFKPRHDSATGKRPVMIPESYMDLVETAMLLTTVEANSHRKIAPANISVSRIRGINRSNLSKGSDTYISFSFHQAQLSMFATILTCRVFWDWKNWLPMTMPCLWQMESILLSALVQVCPLIEIEQLMSLYIDVNVIQMDRCSSKETHLIWGKLQLNMVANFASMCESTISSCVSYTH